MSTYAEEIDNKNIKRIRELLEHMPPFVQDYFNATSLYKSSSTRLGYLRELRLFFNYLESKNHFVDINGEPKQIMDFTLEDLAALRGRDIESYLSSSEYYEIQDERKKTGTTEVTNTAQGKRRKAAALRSFYNYYYLNDRIETNPAKKAAMPKGDEKAITQLDPNEVAILLDVIESGEGLTKVQLRTHKKNKSRDLAIVSLLLGTGIRVSECVGLNLEDIDLNNLAFKVVVKGGDERIIYFSSEVEGYLLKYLEQRKIHLTDVGTLSQKGPVFISGKGTRLTRKAMWEMVKKYSTHVTKIKKITPHKLRATYATEVYRESGDIYLVASVLGHKDVNTTRKHYAKMDDERRKAAAQMVKLRQD